MSKDPSAVELRVDDLERRLSEAEEGWRGSVSALADVVAERDRYRRALLSISTYKPRGNQGLQTQVNTLRKRATDALK